MRYYLCENTPEVLICAPLQHLSVFGLARVRGVVRSLIYSSNQVCADSRGLTVREPEKSVGVIPQMLFRRLGSVNRGAVLEAHKK